MRRTLAVGLALLSWSVLACETKKEPEPAAKASVSPKASDLPRPASVLAVSKPAPERVVAIGDLHGDLDSARRALVLAGAIDDKDAWIGGKLVVVQTGDEIDRGD